MKDSHQLFLAFFIPFSAATVLFVLPFVLFPAQPQKEGISFCLDCNETSLEVIIYGLLVFSLFVLSFALPFFVISRNVPINRTKLNLNTNEN